MGADVFNKCKNGKHRFRENNFVVVFFIDCGMLSNTFGAPKLKKEEIHVYKLKK